MFVELHILQSFAPSCLNRDDTNSPKDCEFGGYRRARISSQCLKRSIRWHPFFKESLAGGIGDRTWRVADDLTRRLSDEHGRPREQAGQVSRAIAKFIDDKMKEDDETTSIGLHMGTDERAGLAAHLYAHWEELTVGSAANMGKAVREVLKGFEFGSRNADLALFGRMVASKNVKSMGIDAACQVAHAVSTHRVSMEMDFYTAVDDLQPQEEPGAGMMGVVEFNSACLYRYSLADVGQLGRNLAGKSATGDDRPVKPEDLAFARKIALAFLRASVAAIPTGKQNSMAAQNRPSLVLAVVRDKGLPCSLANAFLKPVRVSEYGEAESLVEKSMLALDDYWGRIATMYGTEGVVVRPVCRVEEVSLKHLGDQRVDSVEQVYAAVQEALQSGGDA